MRLERASETLPPFGGLGKEFLLIPESLGLTNWGMQKLNLPYFQAWLVLTV